MLVFVENIWHKYDFQGGGVGWSLVGSGGRGWSRPKDKSFNILLIHISMFEVGLQ